MTTEAVILAGGLGTRLLPLTTLIPKPLVPIGHEHSIIDVAIEQLAASGYTHIRIAVGHLSHLIKATIGDGARWGTKISYIEELEPLGTAGPLTIAQDLPTDFLVMNGDVLCDIDYSAMHRQHTESGARLTVAATTRSARHEYGVLHVVGSSVRGFEEKPETRFLVSTGVYVVSRDALTAYPSGTPMGFDTLIKDLIAGGTLPSVYMHTGVWFDVGRPDDYDAVNQDVNALLERLLTHG